MDRAKARTPARAAVTRAINPIEAELAKEEQNVEELELLLQTLEENSENLRDLNVVVMNALLDSDQPEEEIEAESVSVEDYATKIKRIRNKLNKILRPRTPSPTPSLESLTSTTAGGKKTYKLPKIELKKFSGELTEWLGWWSQFEKIHEDDELHDTDKFQFLVQCMTPGSQARALVERYPQSAANYPKVIKDLKNRFGKDKLLRQVYIRELIKIIIKQSRDEAGKIPLLTLYDQLHSHLHSLESLGKVTDPSEFLFPLVESSLPQETLTLWQRSPQHEKDGSKENPPKSKLDYLMEFLQKEIENQQRMSLARSGFGTAEQETKKDFHKNPRKFQEKVPTAAGLFSGESKSCVFCDRKHDTDKCITAQTMSLEEKRQKLNNKKACHNCFKPGHNTKVCKARVKCHLCGRHRHVLMCPDKETKTKPLNRSAKEFESTVTITTLDCTNEVILQTLMVNLENKETGKGKTARVLIDTGSQRSYILRATSEKLKFKPQGKTTLHHLLFGGNHVAGKVHNILDIDLHSTSSDFSETIQLLDQDQICGTISRVTRGPWMNELKEKNIWVNDLSRDNPIEIEILLGADSLGKIFTGRVVPLSNGLTATETRLGWTLMSLI